MNSNFYISGKISSNFNSSQSYVSSPIFWTSGITYSFYFSKKISSFGLEFSGIDTIVSVIHESSFFYGVFSLVLLWVGSNGEGAFLSKGRGDTYNWFSSDGKQSAFKIDLENNVEGECRFTLKNRFPCLPIRLLKFLKAVWVWTLSIELHEKCTFFMMVQLGA